MARIAPHRRRSIRASSVALALASYFCLAASVHADPTGWTMSWNDEFGGTTLDQAKWTIETTNNPNNNEKQAYVASQVAVTGGNLVITSEKISTNGKEYRSGRLHSDYPQRFGRWEIRADLPATKGTWPAIWLLPDASWPSQGEIDIMENRGNQPNLTSSAYHFGTNAPQPYFHDYRYSEQTTAKLGVNQDYHSGFHTYAVEWDATKIRFFVDDVNHWTLYGSDITPYLANQTAPMRTILNTAVGGDFLGGDQQPDATSVWPQKFLIDYVRIFQKNTDPIYLRNGNFEANGGSLAGWSTTGDRPVTNNVSAANQAKDDLASLKLFGGFTGSSNTSGATQGITVAAGDKVRALAESFIRSADAIAGANSVQMKIEFYNDFGGKQGSSSMLSQVSATIATPSSAKDVWTPHELSAVAPAGAVEARISLLFLQPASDGGAIHIDNVKFINERLSPAGDADGDGDVDADDLGAWQQQVGRTTFLTADFNHDGAVDGGDYLLWQQNLGTGVVPATAASNAVPEPWGVAMALLAFARLFRSAPATSVASP